MVSEGGPSAASVVGDQDEAQLQETDRHLAPSPWRNSHPISASWVPRGPQSPPSSYLCYRAGV